MKNEQYGVCKGLERDKRIEVEGNKTINCRIYKYLRSFKWSLLIIIISGMNRNSLLACILQHKDDTFVRIMMLGIIIYYIIITIVH